jgi:mono/diheme cytochrome c family protein
MKRFCAVIAILLGWALVLPWSPASDREGDKDAGGEQPGAKAFAFFKKYCAQCHKKDNAPSEVPDYDVLIYESLTKERKDDDGKVFYYIKPGLKGKEALTNSVVWQHAGKKGVAGADGDMPPKVFKKRNVEPRPTDEEREKILEAWIVAGAPKEGFGEAKNKE